MKTDLFIALTMLIFCACKFVTCSLESLMRETLKKIMKCPINEDEYSSDRPVAAFSPARYTQLVAVARKDSEETACGKEIHHSFDTNDPRTWNFCAMGVCLSHKCYCFKEFNGNKCNKFQGKCWLFYCYRMGCKLELPSLRCACDPSLYGTAVTERIYFYDHGIEENYLPPPAGYTTTDVVESHIIRETLSGSFEVIGGQHMKMVEEDEYQFKNNQIWSDGSILDNKFVTNWEQSHIPTLRKRISRNPGMNQQIHMKRKLKSGFHLYRLADSVKPHFKRKRHKYHRDRSTIGENTWTKTNYNTRRFKSVNYLDMDEISDSRNPRNNYSGSMNFLNIKHYNNPDKFESDSGMPYLENRIFPEPYSAIKDPKYSFPTFSRKTLKMDHNLGLINRRSEYSPQIMWADSVEEGLPSLVPSGNYVNIPIFPFMLIPILTLCFWHFL